MNTVKSISIEQRRAIHRIKLCSCGSGTHWEVIKLILDRAADSAHNRPSFYDKSDDCSGRWVEFAAKTLDHFDLLDHGTGIGCAWLTDEGEALHSFLKEFGTDPHQWPADWEDEVEDDTTVALREE